MAMAQARHVKGLLEARAQIEIEIVGIETSGDKWQGDLADLGGKAAFLKEIERALVADQVDLAVHCLKDVPGDVPPPEGLIFPAYLEREDTRDVMVFPAASGVAGSAELPAGARVGTSAVRRQAQLAQIRPDLRVEHVRGNVNSRLGRLDAGAEFDAIIVAKAGLERLGLDRPYEILDMLSAVGAGVLALQCRQRDTDIVELLRPLDHPDTRTCALAERTMLHILRGHCNSPIAGRARLDGDGRLSLHGMVFTPDGDRFVRSHGWASPGEAAELGARVAADLLQEGARELIDGIPH